MNLFLTFAKQDSSAFFQCFYPKLFLYSTKPSIESAIIAFFSVVSLYRQIKFDYSLLYYEVIQIYKQAVHFLSYSCVYIFLKLNLIIVIFSYYFQNLFYVFMVYLQFDMNWHSIFPVNFIYPNLMLKFYLKLCFLTYKFLCCWFFSKQASKIILMIFQQVFQIPLSSKQLFFNNKIWFILVPILDPCMIIEDRITFALKIRQKLFFFTFFINEIGLILIKIIQLLQSYESDVNYYNLNCLYKQIQIIMKIFILIIILVVYGTAFQQIINKNNKVEQVLSELGGADIDKGEAITQTILDQSKAIFEQAYVFNGESISANVQYIRTKMNQLYEGNYAIIIFNDNTTSPIINTNLQFSIQSINNSWWFYWKGPNHYKPTYAYYIARNAKNTSGTSLAANGSDSSTYYNTTTKNVINAVQQDSSDISYNVKTIKSYISALNTTRKVSIIISKNISYYLSVQGITGYDHYSPTLLQKFNDLIWYTV